MSKIFPCEYKPLQVEINGTDITKSSQGHAQSKAQRKSFHTDICTDESKAQKTIWKASKPKFLAKNIMATTLMCKSHIRSDKEKWSMIKLSKPRTIYLKSSVLSWIPTKSPSSLSHHWNPQKEENTTNL